MLTPISFQVPLQASTSRVGIILEMKDNKEYTVGRDFSCSIILHRRMFKDEENLQYNKVKLHIHILQTMLNSNFNHYHLSKGFKSSLFNVF